MEYSPLISVVVPVYKVADYLDRCVRSLVDQTYNNIEIILVDDGSPDSCAIICDEWIKKDKRIQVIHKKNGGLSDARNIGMFSIKGEYISFIDSDDWIDLNTFELVMKRIRETNAQIGAFNLVNVDSEHFSVDLSDEYDVIDPEVAIENTIDDTGVRTVAWNKVYYKSILDNLFFPNGKLHEDEFFTFQALAKAKRIVYLHRQCYYYFQRPSGIMGQYNIKHIDMLEGVKNRMDFVEVHYPNLFCKAKISFSLCCFNQYKNLLKYGDANDKKIGKKKIKKLRKSIHIKIADVVGMNKKTALLHLLSNRSFGLDFCCRVYNNKTS